MNYIFMHGSGGTVSQGVQQAYEIFTTAVSDFSMPIELSVYPNPVADELKLKISNGEHKQIQFRLLDISGKVLITEYVTQEITSVSLVAYPAAIYALDIYSGNQPVKSFRIIKK